MSRNPIQNFSNLDFFDSLSSLQEEFICDECGIQMNAKFIHILQRLKLKRLSLNDNQIWGILPAKIKRLSSFSAKRNKITAVENDLFQQSPDDSNMIDYIDLSYNQISMDLEALFPVKDAKSIPTTELSNNNLYGNIGRSFPEKNMFIHIENNSPGPDCLGLPMWCSSILMNGTGDCWPCNTQCGDGVWIQEKEYCDDGNKMNGDGCSSKCEIESGYSCLNSLKSDENNLLKIYPSICTKSDDNRLILILVFTTIIPTMMICIVIVLILWRKLKQSQDFFESYKKHFMTSSEYFIIHSDEIKRDRIIGEGNFGKVYHGLLRETVEIAIKELKHEELNQTLSKPNPLFENNKINNNKNPKSSSSPSSRNKMNQTTTSKEFEDFVNEARTMCMVPPHPNIISLLGICVNPKDQTIMIITEFLKKGSLKNYLQFRIDISVDNMINMCQGIASGMCHLNKLNIIHNDLAARNVLVQEMAISDDEFDNYHLNSSSISSSGSQRFITNVKITDFGLASAKLSSLHQSISSSSSSTTSDQHHNMNKVPIRWTAPEVLEKKENGLNLKSDVWSFAVVVYEIFSYCRIDPYNGIKTSQILPLLKRGDRLEKPDGSPDWIYSLMLNCMNYFPSERPTFEEIHKTILDQRNCHHHHRPISLEMSNVNDIKEKIGDSNEHPPVGRNSIIYEK
eukprot:TRINITY_DN3870_c0_g1_i3.p1 TRINITY_DN3870_c0_g1~~TRINITY_DN3870_c0_g1_i3.p1  ORF type:complete len:680 (-),score=173.12 TRINITY_DN3870_c0_g1_i3:253-2292(-)